MLPEKRLRSLLLVLFAACVLLVSCSDDDSPTGPTSPPQPIPDEVLELAGNIFSLIGMALEGNTDVFDGFWTEPESLPDEFTDGFVLTIFCEDMEPEPPHGPIVNGIITVTAREIGSTKRLLLDGELALTDEDDMLLNNVVIDGTAIWETGGPDDSEPDRITGTFTVNGDDYDLGRIVELLEEQEDDGDQPINPVPELFRDAQLHCTQIRILGQGDEEWQYHTYHRFFISDCGQYYTMRLGANWDTPEEQIDAECTGTINWHTEGAVQRLYFYDDDGVHDRLFTVVEYDNENITLNIEWGSAEVWDMRFDIVRF